MNTSMKTYWVSCLIFGGVLAGVFCAGLCRAGEIWTIDSQEQWQSAVAESKDIKLEAGQLIPQVDTALFAIKPKKVESKQSLKSVTIRQTPVWNQWEAVPKVAPKEAYGDAPVFLPVAPGDYWILNPVVLHSTDMKNWTKVAPRLRGMTTSAEYANGKFYIYYDKPNDRDWWVYVDDDLTDEKPGTDTLVLKKPYLGSDAAAFRDEDGTFHCIYENYEPGEIRAYDSALAGHSSSSDGIHGFKPDMYVPPIDTRGKYTGRTGRWSTHPTELFPEELKALEESGLKGKSRRKWIEHKLYDGPKDVYGDYTLIQVGKWYYLFCDYDPDPVKKKSMRVGRWRTDDITKPFVWDGEIGEDMHPDPTIGFAEGRFFLLVQNNSGRQNGLDFVSDGPWVDGVEVRAGVDTDNDGNIDQWTPFTKVKETYAQKPGFCRIVDTTPATLDTSSLPSGYRFQIELKTEKTKDVQPVIDAVEAVF